MTTHTSTLERLADARPVLHPDQIVGPEERARLLASILVSVATDSDQPNQGAAPRDRRLVVAVMGVAAAALILGLVGRSTWSHSSGHSGRPAAGGEATSAGTPTGAAHIKVQLMAALTDVDRIEHVQSHFTANGNETVTDDSWTSPDGNTVRDQSFVNGQPAYDETMVTANGEMRATVIDVPDRAWWTLSTAAPTGSCPASINCVVVTAPSSLTPAQIQAEVQAGTLHVIGGQQLVDGHQTIEVSGFAAQAAPAFGTFDLWIDVSTYLPVRSSTTRSDGTGAATSDFEWLAPSAANLAQLQVTVPPGFTYSALPIAPAAPAGRGLG